MRKNLDAKEEQKLAQRNYSIRSSHEIKTFDDILNENLQELETLREFGRGKDKQRSNS